MTFARDLPAATVVATQVRVGTVPVNVAPAASPVAARKQVVVTANGLAWVGLASDFTASAAIPIASGLPYSEKFYSGDVYVQTTAASVAITVWDYRG